MAEEVKLFGIWASIFSFRIQVALKLKGIEYEYIEENLSEKSDLLLKYNPVHKKVPVLIHNGKPIAESLIILEYIDQTWKHNPLLPQHPYQKAIAHFWAKFIDEKIVQTAAKVAAAKDDEKEQILEEIKQQLNFLSRSCEERNSMEAKALDS